MDSASKSVAATDGATAPLVSVLIVTYGRREHVVKCVESCLKQDYGNMEILVFVNGGSSDTANAVEALDPCISVTKTHKNLGFFPVLNIAIANAQGTYMLTLDDDAWLASRDVVSKMVGAFQRDSSLGAVTCNIRGPFESAHEENDRYVASFKTGFTMVYEKVFTEWVGSYPDVFFRSGGENYLATALWDIDRPIVQLADVEIHHDQTSIGRSNWDWMFYGVRSQALLVIMRDPWFLVGPRLAVKFCKSLIHSIYRGRALACLAGWWSTVLHAPVAVRFRRPIRWSTVRRLQHLKRTFQPWQQAGDSSQNGFRRLD